MAWVVKLEEVIEGKVVSCRKVVTLERPEGLGLRLEDGKALLAEIQSVLVAQQFERDREARLQCPSCGESVKKLGVSPCPVRVVTPKALIG